MDDYSRQGSLSRWRTLREEIEALESNPVARSLLNDLQQQDLERVRRLVTELREGALLEELRL